MEVDEEEAWLNEKTAYLTSDEAGDTLAAVQELMKKHEAFETDLNIHCERVRKIEKEGQQLVSQVWPQREGERGGGREREREGERERGR